MIRNRRGALTTLLTLLALSIAVPAAAQLPPPPSARVVFSADAIGAGAASGVADRSTGRETTIDDPVRVASISKLVVAMGVMKLVEAGTLSLDRDVSGWLGYTLRNPAFPNKPITLRMLLSHTAGLTDAQGYALPVGETVQAIVSDSRAWDSAHPPGGYFRYGNINFPVIASVMERASGKRFDILMRDTVLMPLGLDACFGWTTCSERAVARAVVLYDLAGPVRRDDLRGRQPDCAVYPAADGRCDISAYRLGDNGSMFSPQGGLRISMSGLARLGQLLLRGGEGFLSRRSVRLMTTPLWRYNGRNGDTEGGFFCRYGLAVQTLATRRDGCKDDPFGDARARIGHAGEAYGLRSGLWIDTKARTGLAFFTSAVADDAPKGRSAFTAAEEAMIAEPAQR